MHIDWLSHILKFYIVFMLLVNINGVDRYIGLIWLLINNKCR